MAEAHPIPKNPKFQDLTGMTFGRWTVLCYAGKLGAVHRWYCRCSCGNEVIVHGTSLRAGRSCQCMTCSRVNRPDYHGHTGTPEYTVWEGIVRRCENKNFTGYKGYGGRGIKVCESWRESFVAFLADMGPRPGPGYSIERDDVNGNYEPSNCRWATPKEQGRNRRNNAMLTLDGRTQCASAWAEERGINIGTIFYRIKAGWSDERVLEPIESD